MTTSTIAILASVAMRGKASSARKVDVMVGIRRRPTKGTTARRHSFWHGRRITLRAIFTVTIVGAQGGWNMSIDRKRFVSKC
jgi:hypothetical protein